MDEKAEAELGTYHLGANLDTRTPAEAAEQDVTAHETIASAATVSWIEMARDAVRTFTVQDQHGKSDCVAESRKKIKEILFKVNRGISIVFSSVAFYRKRSNFPGEGMIASNAIELDSNIGMTLDVLVPSDVVTTEAAANAIAPDSYNDDIAKVFRTNATDIVFTPGDLDTIAGTIQKTRKGVMIWFFATVAEWSQEVPEIQVALTSPSDPRSVVVHSVVGVEAALYKGVKGIWIEDSAHFGGLNRRFITETFFRARNWFASYPISFKFEGSQVSTKPHHVFSKDLQFSANYFTDADVVALQDILKYEGFFPTNVDSTGYFGALTLDAVKKFQAAHGIAPIAGFVGVLTRKYLNDTYGA